MQANMFRPSTGMSLYMDKFGGEGFHAWKLRMAFLLKRDESLCLVNGDRPMLRIPTIRV
jgi:hypothetical protein